MKNLRDLSRNNRLAAPIGVALVLICFLLLFGQYTTSPRASTARHSGITHLVMFQYKAGASPGAVSEANERMLALKNSCRHPESGLPYIKALTGGKDNSIEGLQNGVTHAFVVEFATANDRDYYVKTDPAHQAFIKSISSVVDKATVVDFSGGVF